MDISEQLTCLFSTTIEAKDDSYVIEIPKREVDVGHVDPTKAYQLGVFSQSTNQKTTKPSSKPNPEPDHSGPPVSEGDTRIVEIEEIGDQGDGLARVDRGYVVIIPDTDRGERVEIEIETVRKNVAFARVVERLDYYG